ncbi:MAG: AMP-binding protein [Solirubrobacterales bacterium]
MPPTPRRSPSRPEAETRTFGELEERANRVAGALAARGVGPGENVAILMRNCIEFVESFLGIQKLGACATRSPQPSSSPTSRRATPPARC